MSAMKHLVNYVPLDQSILNDVRAKNFADSRSDGGGSSGFTSSSPSSIQLR